MAILFPGEKFELERGISVDVDVLINNNMSMLSNILDLNGQKRILISDGTDNRILIGYQAGGF